MRPEDIEEQILSMREQAQELEKLLEDPSTYSELSLQKSLFRSRQRFTQIFSLFDSWKKALEDAEGNRELIQTEQDEEFKSLLESDLLELEKKALEEEKALSLLLLPPDPNDGRSCIVEMRPAAGGDEAALFTAQMFHLYTKFAEKHSWKLEVMSVSETGLGGIKEVIFSLDGEDVFSFMKFESGVHRVQRVPVTETSGRTHTSTITVSVLPEAEETDDIEIKQEDLEISTFRSSGPGGQNVNRTDSAVRIVHKPSGLVAASQQERSQIRNREIAMRILKSKLLEIARREEAALHAASKRSQIGTGDRSERIRTYNFPQNRVTDHRYNVSAFDLPSLMEGNLELILDQIMEVESKNALESLLNG